MRCLGVQLFGGKIDVDEHGETIRGDTHAAVIQRRPCQYDPVQVPRARQRRRRGNWYSTRLSRNSRRIRMRRWERTTPWRPARWSRSVRRCRKKRRLLSAPGKSRSLRVVSGRLFARRPATDPRLPTPSHADDRNIAGEAWTRDRRQGTDHHGFTAKGRRFPRPLPRTGCRRRPYAGSLRLA